MAGSGLQGPRSADTATWSKITYTPKIPEPKFNTEYSKLVKKLLSLQMTLRRALGISKALSNCRTNYELAAKRN